jgi:hypothetical protein
LLSLQGVPFAAVGLEQVPVLGLHVPAVWQAVGAGHATGEPAVQAPLWQVSPVVQALLSLQAAPLALAGFEHRPVVVLHVPALWH